MGEPDERAAPIKVLAFIKKRPDLSAAEFRDYYENRHAPLVNRLLPFYREYRRNYLDASVRPGQEGLGFDVVTELVFASPADYDDWLATLGDAEVIAQIRADEANFLESGTTRMWKVSPFADDLPLPGAGA